MATPNLTALLKRRLRAVCVCEPRPGGNQGQFQGREGHALAFMSLHPRERSDTRRPSFKTPGPASGTSDSDLHLSTSVKGRERCQNHSENHQEPAGGVISTPGGKGEYGVFLQINNAFKVSMVRRDRTAPPGPVTRSSS